MNNKFKTANEAFHYLMPYIVEHGVEFDTPCTYAIQFTIVDNKLNMCVTMRSNDLWYGFCNDQYCFSMLQQLVARELSVPVGTYFHFAHNLHLYNNIIEKINE